jgi:hypothetical protein
MRTVSMVVGSKPIGKARTWAYPDGFHLGTFTIPTYGLTVSGVGATGKKEKRTFEVFRFGVHFKKGFSAPRVVGLAEQQTHVIKDWLPDYSVHSARSVERGAWQVYDSFLIHDGPDEPRSELYASIGCVEICNGPRGFDAFNDFLIALSGPKAKGRAEQLREIGKARKMTITYEKATRPPLESAAADSVPAESRSLKPGSRSRPPRDEGRGKGRRRGRTRRVR